LLSEAAHPPHESGFAGSPSVSLEVPIVHPASIRDTVRRARDAGLSARVIHQITGVPPRSQRRISSEKLCMAPVIQEAPQSQAPRVGRPSVLAPELRGVIDTLLAESPGMKVAEVLRCLRTEHAYQEGKNPVYTYVRAVRPKAAPPLPVVRFEGVAGEFAQHDFGSVAVRYPDGTTERLHFYAGRLKYSRALYVGLAAGETAECFLRGVEAFARAVGGLPQRNVVDNMKAAVLRRERDPETGQERIHLNPHFADFLKEVGVFAEPAFPYSGNQKGSVENLVKFAKGAFFTARTFRNREDLQRQLTEWLQYVNEVRICDATGEIPQDRCHRERPWLRPLPFGSRGYGLAHSVVVGPDARVRHGGYAYSTPDHWIGQTVLLRLHPEHVVLHSLGEQCTHPRQPENGKYSLLPEHRPPLFVKPRGKIMAQRQILMDLCPEGERFFTELVHRRPHTWREQDLPVVWRLFEELGEERLAQALRFCVAREAFGGEYLQAYSRGLFAGAQA
jgi:transposase